MALLVVLVFPACGISVPDLQKRWRAVLLSATQCRFLQGKQQAQKDTTATASSSPATAGRAAPPGQVWVYSCPHSLLFPFLPYTVLGHFQTYTPMGLSSFYTHHTLACFSLKWVIQILCHSASLPIATGFPKKTRQHKKANSKVACSFPHDNSWGERWQEHSAVLPLLFAWVGQSLLFRVLFTHTLRKVKANLLQAGEDAHHSKHIQSAGRCWGGLRVLTHCLCKI